MSVLKDSVIPLTPVTHRHYPTRRRNSRSFKRTLWDLTEHFKMHSQPSVQPPPPWNECRYIVLHCTFHCSEQWSYWFILAILMKSMMIGGENRSDFQGGLLTVVSAEMLTSARKGFQRNTERKKHPDMKLNVICLSASLLKPNGSKVQNAESKIHYQLLCSQKQQKEKDRPREVTGPSHTDLVWCEVKCLQYHLLWQVRLLKYKL